MMNTPRILVASALALSVACSDDTHSTAAAVSEPNYLLSSVVISPSDDRTTYVQTIHSLDDGPFNNEAALELPGDAVVMPGNDAFFVGLAEEPTWVRYVIESGKIKQSGKLSLLSTGAKRIDYGNAIIDDETAVSVLSDPPLAVIWNPQTMELRGQVPLDDLVRDGYTLEVWTTIAHNGLVYIPGRWSDWDGSRIYPSVSTTILDPKAMKVIGTAQDDRCASGGRVVFGSDGYAYVMGDGRNYSIQMFANASGGTAPDNCLLRIAPGDTKFDPDYSYTIPSLTGGLESITELITAKQDSGIGFSMMFYPDQLPDDVKPVDFSFWDVPAHKMWRLQLSDPPSAEEVKNIPFSTVGYDPSELDGQLYAGIGDEQGNSQVWAIDPDSNVATQRFSMDGYFNGIYKLSK